MKEKKVNYVDNKKFYETIVEHRRRVEESAQKGLEPPRLPEYIGECIWKIANKLSNKPCFINYSYRDEMISDGIENCIMYFKDFDPNKTQNPFAYFTQIIYYAFLRRINKEEKNRYIIYKNFQETIINNGHNAYLTDTEDNHIVPTQMYDNINSFMGRFEEKEELKKQKRKEQKLGLTKFYEEDKDEQRSAVSG
jgi:hypothetical protein